VSKDIKRRVETAPTFERDLRRLSRRYKNIRKDIEPIVDELIAGGLPGDRIAGVAAVVYKVRAANSDARRGKSGGYRVIYYLPLGEVVVLLTLYSKSDQGDIAPREIRKIIDEELN
jgi:mRNA-degrading endonuclease RelE of RelBE toxin-antitoxin system